MDLTFFGITKTNAALYRKNLFSQIHEIVFHGNGGYTDPDVYNMPTWRRKYIYYEMENYYKKKNGQTDNENTAIRPDGTVANPNALKDPQTKSVPVSKPGVTPKNRPTTYK